MRLGTTYISVNDFAKSLAFYQLLLEQEPLYCNDDRWATFDCGNSLSLYNRQFDIDFLVNNDYRGHYNHSYLTTLKNENSDKINTSVIFNFEVEDLISEYERIKKLKIHEAQAKREARKTRHDRCSQQARQAGFCGRCP